MFWRRSPGDGAGISGAPGLCFRVTSQTPSTMIPPAASETPVTGSSSRRAAAPTVTIGSR
jgi:hypothetical protein